jgi:hypothetical protein
VDSVSGINVVVWEKPVTTLIESYNVYKETSSAGVYALEGNVPYDSLSLFEDVNSNPAIKADRYRVSIVDIGGTESGQSGFHKTIHLTMNLGIGGEVNLIWDDYEGINFSTYNIYKGNAGGMNLLASVANTLTSYTDLTPIPNDSLYVIEVVHPSGCTASKTKNFNSSKSNTSSVGSAPTISVALSSTVASIGNCDGTATANVSGGTAPYTYSWNTTPVQTTATATGLCGNTYYVVTVNTADPATVVDSVFVAEATGIGNLALSDLLRIYPNPTEGELAVEFSSVLNEGGILKVLNAVGALVLSEPINGEGRTVIELTPFGPGLYVVQIETSLGTIGRKVMVQ